MHIADIQKREWDDKTHYFPEHKDSLLYYATALAGEVGETCNVIKKYDRGSLDYGELVEKLYDELPDILIYLVMLAEKEGIDLEAAYETKKEFNERRYRG